MDNDPFMLKSDVVKSYIMNDAGNMMNWAVFLIEMFKIDFLDGPTSRAIKILLLEEIPNNHLGYIGIRCQPQLVNAGFLNHH